MMFELHYSTGGHGGPYRSLFEAKIKALELLKGNHNDQWIAIRSRTVNLEVARITREHLQQVIELGAVTASWNPNKRR